MLNPKQVRLLSIWYYCSNSEKSENALKELKSQGIDPDDAKIIEEYTNSMIQFK